MIIWDWLRDMAVTAWGWLTGFWSAAVLGWWWAWLAAAALAAAVVAARRWLRLRRRPAQGWRNDPDIPRFGADPADIDF